MRILALLKSDSPWLNSDRARCESSLGRGLTGHATGPGIRRGGWTVDGMYVGTAMKSAGLSMGQLKKNNIFIVFCKCEFWPTSKNSGLNPGSFRVLVGVHLGPRLLADGGTILLPSLNSNPRSATVVTH